MSEGIGRKEVERSSQVINDGREDRIQEEIVEKQPGKKLGTAPRPLGWVKKWKSLIMIGGQCKKVDSAGKKKGTPLGD